MKIDDARAYAYNAGVDLVLIVANATPPYAVLSTTVSFALSVIRRKRKLRRSRLSLRSRKFSFPAELSSTTLIPVLTMQGNSLQRAIR